MAGKLWKVKRGKKLIGSWHFTAAGGDRINTHTSDADAALKFRAKWLRDKAAATKTEAQGAAAATIAALDEPADLPPPSEPPPAAAATTPPAGDAHLPPGYGTQPGAPQPIAPDGYAPPPASGDWTQDAARAAAAARPALGPTIEPEADPLFLNDLLEDFASMAVELQIVGQEWAIARGVKLKAAVVPPDNRGRQKGKELWVKQFRLWMPTDIDLPGWIAAPLAVAAATVPIQLNGATPLPTAEQKPTDAQPTTEAPSGGA